MTLRDFYKRKCLCCKTEWFTILLLNNDGLDDLLRGGGRGNFFITWLLKMKFLQSLRYPVEWFADCLSFWFREAVCHSYILSGSKMECSTSTIILQFVFWKKCTPPHNILLRCLFRSLILKFHRFNFEMYKVGFRFQADFNSEQNHSLCPAWRIFFNQVIKVNRPFLLWTETVL